MKKGVIGVLSFVVGAASAAAGMNYYKDKEVNEKKKKVDKFKNYYNMLNQWMILKQKGLSVDTYFTRNGYKSIAIYGMGEMGHRLYDDLKDTGIEVKYAVDQNADSTYSELRTIHPDEALEAVDCIVVTATFAYNEIADQLADTCSFPIVSLDDVVYEADYE